MLESSLDLESALDAEEFEVTIEVDVELRQPLGHKLVFALKVFHESLGLVDFRHLKSLWQLDSIECLFCFFWRHFEQRGRLDLIVEDVEAGSNGHEDLRRTRI